MGPRGQSYVAQDRRPLSWAFLSLTPGVMFPGPQEESNLSLNSQKKEEWGFS